MPSLVEIGQVVLRKSKMYTEFTDGQIDRQADGHWTKSDQKGSLGFQQSELKKRLLHHSSSA